MTLLQLFKRKDPLPLEVRPAPVLESNVSGRRVEPSKPYDWQSATKERWIKTDLAATFERARREVRG
jgi:hypothetical protein